MTQIIGLSGKAGSGKDFIGREVLRPLGFSQWAMSWPLKNALVGQVGYSYEGVHFDKPPRVRAALQKIGTEDGWMQYGKQYWCKVAEAWWRTLGLDRVYITDIRFPHEIDWIQDLGGKVVRINIGNRKAGLTGRAAEHISETALDDWMDWDAVIFNNVGTTVDQIRALLVSKGVLPKPEEVKQASRVEDHQLCLPF